jgi:hypothetical protein
MNDLELGVIGNCVVAALIDRDACVVWYCLPRFDGDPVFHTLLGAPRDAPDAGMFAIELEEHVQSTQRYVANTVVLETELHGKHGSIRVTDFIPRFLWRDRASRIGLVTPLRDGMNLVAKEYVAAQDDADPGVLILSRFAGAAEDLQEALIVNPYDIDEVAHAMRRAIEMTNEERIERHQALMSRIRQHDACNWMVSFLRALSSCREQLADNVGARSIRRRNCDQRRRSLVAMPTPSGPSNSRSKLTTGTKFGGGSTSLNYSRSKTRVPF